MTGMFKQREGDAAVVVENGVFRQTDVYSRSGYLFAKVGPGFIRLYADGSTSKAKCRLDVLHVECRLQQDRFGRLCDDTVAEAGMRSAPEALVLAGEK